MKRSELRENIFKLLFRVEFNSEEDMKEQVGLYFEDIQEEGAKTISEKNQKYIEDKYKAIVEKLEDIDKEIEEVSNGWQISRLGKVELTIIRLALYEIRYDEDVPTGVAINEAVELAKKFGGDEAPAFINGILAKMV
ncbi:MAG: transcription antitermination factor NusB [Lachnospiraceae bacterium]|nr:transcription antitermination factor NusB [Lachnospiraceae bacterium]